MENINFPDSDHKNSRTGFVIVMRVVKRVPLHNLVSSHYATMSIIYPKIDFVGIGRQRKSFKSNLWPVAKINEKLSNISIINYLHLHNLVGSFLTCCISDKISLRSKPGYASLYSTQDGDSLNVTRTRYKMSSDMSP